MALSMSKIPKEGKPVKHEKELACEVYRALMDHPEGFKIWFWGSACVGKKFSVILDTFRSSPTIQVHVEQDERTPKEVADAQRCIEVEVPFWWRRRILRAAKTVVVRTALNNLKPTA